MKKFLLALVCIAFNLHLFGQFDFGRVKDVYNKTKKTLDDHDIDPFKGADEDHDATSYNYAIAFLDNAGLFEVKENFFKRQKLLLGVLDDGLSGNDVTNKTNQENANDLNEVGERMYAYRKYKLAEESFIGAKNLHENKQGPEYANTISNLGLLYHTTGRLSKAEKYTREAWELRKGMAKDLQAISMNNLSVILKDKGLYNEAEQLINEAIVYNKETIGDKTIQQAVALNNKAIILHNLGRYEDAEKAMKQCLAIAKEELKEKSANYVKLKINLALLYRDSKAYDKAEREYKEAIEIKERKMGKKHPDYAHLLKGLAALYMETGNYKEVEELLKEAETIYEKKFGEEHPSYASTINDLGSYYRVRKQYPKAQQHLQKAVDLRKKLLGTQHPDYIQSLEEQALLEWETGNINASQPRFAEVIATTMAYKDNYFASMSEAEKEKFWATLTPRLDKYYSFIADNHAQHPTLIKVLFELRMETKGLLLNNSNRIKNTILNSGDEALIAKYNQWIDKKEELARLYTYSKEELKEEEIDLGKLEEETNQLEKDLAKQSSLFSDGFLSDDDHGLETIKSALTAEEALLEIVTFRKFNSTFTDSITYAFIVQKPGKDPGLVLLEHGHKLNGSYFKYYRNTIIHHVEDKKSYDRFWSPVQPALTGVSTVYISLDGVYNQININTLKDAKGQYVLEKENLVFLTNARDLPVVKQRRASSAQSFKTHNKAHLYGFPTYGEGEIIPLPGTKAEVNAINTTLKKYGFNTSLFLASNATEENVKMQASNAGILHIATHGFFLSDVDYTGSSKVFGIETSKAKQNPLHRAGLLFAGASETMTGEETDHTDSNNGVLTAYEVMNLNLQNTDLLVMSACETGKGDVKAGEGVYGLQRAFQVAGVKSLVMSLWKVDDAATMLLMNTFYKYLMADSKKDLEIAFIKAQKALKVKYPDPFYWGAFVLIEN